MKKHRQAGRRHLDCQFNPRQFGSFSQSASSGCDESWMSGASHRGDRNCFPREARPRSTSTKATVCQLLIDIRFRRYRNAAKNGTEYRSQLLVFNGVE